MWIETSHEVYSVIHAKHRKDLSVHSSFTDSTGTGYHFSSGRPEIITEWGFINAYAPLLKLRQTKEKEEDKEWEYEFFIYCAPEQSDL
jgi:hypothetical protein